MAQEKITKLTKTDKTKLLYAADQIGYIYVYDTEKFAPEQRSPKGNLQQSLVKRKKKSCILSMRK